MKEFIRVSKDIKYTERNPQIPQKFIQFFFLCKKYVKVKPEESCLKMSLDGAVKQ